MGGKRAALSQLDRPHPARSSPPSPAGTDRRLVGRGELPKPLRPVLVVRERPT